MTSFVSQQFFPAILNMSLTAGVVILFVLAVRLALKRAPKVFSYALWAVVLFRLLCPVSLSTGFSLLNVVDTPVSDTTSVASRVEYVPAERILAARRAEQAQATQPLTAPQTGSQAAKPAPEEPQSQPAHVALSAAEAAPWVWLVGLLGLAGYSLIALFQLRRRLVGAMGLRGNLYLADHIQTPFVLGLIRPRIYLPSDLTEREMGYIILHEQYHIRHGDHIIKVLAFVALCLHWFNPLVWVAFVLAGRDMEMRCDEAVVRQLGEGVRADYSASLLTLATGRLSIAGTPLAFGEGDPKGRIRNLLRWKKPKLWLSLAAGAACAAVIAACAANPAGQNSPASSGGMTGQYESMEDFARQTMDSAKEVTYTKRSDDTALGEEATARVTGTKIAWLDKQGEVTGLAPEGTLEAWTFSYLVQIDAPTEEVALVGGMYEEDGWFDLEGQGGYNIVALRHSDGSYDILYDQIVNDNGFLAYHNSYGEAIYDWYVKEKGLDLPLYVEDWTDKITYSDGDDHGNYPVHRYDGDGWYFYLPVSAWTQWGSGMDRWVWTSDYNTGSSITVESIQTNLDDYLETETQGMTPVDGSERVFQAQEDGRSYRYYYWDMEDGYWKITIQWVDANITDYPYIAIEPQALQAMAESFTLDPSIIAARSTGSLLTGITEGETEFTLTLTPEDGVPGTAYGDCWGTANGAGYYSGLTYLTWQPCSMPASGASLGASVTLQGPGWTLTAYEGTSAAAYDDGSGVLWLVPDLSADQSVYQILRGWYDEVEFWALGGGYEQQDRIVIPDSGQDYLAAAAEFCTRLEEFHLQASSGSSFCWTYVQCLTEPAGDIPAFEDLPDNVHPFYLTTVFVPENQNALNQSMAGNTGDYTGDDPSVPEGAFEYGRCGFITLEADGWHGELVGTGW